MSSVPFERLPYVPGLQPPYQEATLAVGFSESSVNTQTANVTAVGRTAKINVLQNTSIPTQILNDTIEGQAVIQLLGGAPVWIGFSSQITIDTAFRLVVDDPYTMREIIPVWAIGVNNPDIPSSIVQVSLVE